MIFPEPKTWTEDKAMTINPSSDNYKMGFNDAIKEFKRLNKEAHPLVELDEYGLKAFLIDRFSQCIREHAGQSQRIGQEHDCAIPYADDCMPYLKTLFGTKSEPVKMTHEEIINLLISPSKSKELNINFGVVNRYKANFLAKSLHTALYGGGE